MEQTFMKEKKILPLVLSMSLPMVISMAVNSLYNIVDSYFVAKLSEDAMTALALVYPIQNMINAIAIGFSIGINACAAYFLGANDSVRTSKTATQGTFLSCSHGIVLTVLSIAVMLFQAVGKMKVSMLCMMCGFVVNIILDPLMIFGIGFFPAMGIAGAAYATGIGQVFSLAVYYLCSKISPIPIKIERKYWKPEKNIAARLYSVGISATLTLALPSLLISVLNGILAGFSETYVLVLGVYYKLQTFIYLTANGIIQGIRPLMGYNYGAGEKERVQKIFRTSLALTMGVMVVGTFLSWLFPASLFGMFTSNPQTIKIGVTALHIISLGFVVSAVSITCCGALEGLGKGTPSLCISLLRYAVVIIPAAYILSKFIGADGVWYAFCFTEFVTAGLAYIIYKKSS